MELPFYHDQPMSAPRRGFSAWPRAGVLCGWVALSATLGAAAEVKKGQAARAQATATAAPATTPATGGVQPVQEAAKRSINIFEFAVIGSKSLPRIEVEEAVYPFTGPGRTLEDIDRAAQALKKAYHDKGFTFTDVIVPQDQSFLGGLVILQAVEGKVGSLRVSGAKYFLPSKMKAQARSLAEGKVLNSTDVTRDIVALNQLADRRVEPKLIPRGDEPGVYDIELAVQDKLPLHGSIELNNRKSANTTDLRLNASLSYANLWQRGHTLGASYQTSPEDRSEVKVYSGYYIWRFEHLDWLSVMFTGTKQDSNVSTLGGVAVAGRGEILGVRAIATLPSKPGFYHSLNAGIDYKHFDQNVVIGDTTDVAPISYYPLSLAWDGTWLHSRQEDDPTKPGEQRRIDLGTTELSLGVTMNFRGLGSTNESLERNRFGAEGNFFYFRGDLSHEQELPGGWQAYVKIHGQAANQPLVNSEQFGGGGMGTARGYLEAEALGDSAIFGTIEIRTPSLLRTEREGEKTGDEWRFYTFLDAGTLSLMDALPEQEDTFRLASIGLGSEIQIRKHFHGIVELALPLISLGNTQAHEPRINFRLWADF
jgi:hemolysin activation/secretion protein